MCYRCEVCLVVVPPGNSMRRHQILRPDRTIAREVAVCGECQGRLADRPPAPTPTRLSRRQLKLTRLARATRAQARAAVESAPSLNGRQSP